MLYKDIDKEVARQCCKEHTIKTNNYHIMHDCDKCPLRRDFKDVNGNTRRGVCWFILMKGLEPYLMDQSPYAIVDKQMLELEHVSYPLEWLKWLETHEFTIVEPDKFNFESED